jgi:hypothetical protein
LFGITMGEAWRGRWSPPPEWKRRFLERLSIIGRRSGGAISNHRKSESYSF